MGGYPSRRQMFEQEGGDPAVEWPLPLQLGLLEGVEGCGVILEFDGQQVALIGAKNTFGLALIERGGRAGKQSWRRGGRQGNGRGRVGVCPPPERGERKARSSCSARTLSAGSLRRSSHSA